ncbi:MAG: LytR C-terminal domain-containing protein [Acidimicrobiales bacterium]
MRRPTAEMMADRLERHDIVNAAALAGVLLLFGFLIVTATTLLFRSVSSGVVESSKEPPALNSETAGGSEGDGSEGDGAAAADDSGEAAAADPPAVEPVTEARPPAEVTVRVGNGARRIGVAAAGTALVAEAGYPTLPPKNAPTSEPSIVYFSPGYEADARRLAEVLVLDEPLVAPMPPDPGVPVDGAAVVVILGVDSQY